MNTNFITIELTDIDASSQRDQKSSYPGLHRQYPTLQRASQNVTRVNLANQYFPSEFYIGHTKNIADNVTV